MASKLKLYMDFMSPPSRTLYIILKQCGTPFDIIPVALRKGEHLTNDYKKINKFQKIPYISEGDFQLGESVAILRYLFATNRISEKFYTNDAKERAKIDEFLEWQHTLGVDGVAYFRLSWVAPLITGKPTPEKQLEAAKKNMEKSLDILENLWLESSKFVAGNKLSAADVFGVSMAQQAKMSNYDYGEKYPKIAAWIENVRQGTNPDFDDAHKFVYKYSKK